MNGVIERLEEPAGDSPAEASIPGRPAGLAGPG